MDAQPEQVQERKVTLTEGQLANLLERASAYSAANIGTPQHGSTSQQQPVAIATTATFPSNFMAPSTLGEDATFLPKFLNAPQQQVLPQQHNNFFDLEALLQTAPSAQAGPAANASLFPRRTSTPPQAPFFAHKYVRYRSVVKFLRRKYPQGIQLRALWKALFAGSQSEDEDAETRADLLSVTESWSGRARARLIAIEMSAVVHFEGAMVKGKKGAKHYGIRFADEDTFYAVEQPKQRWDEDSATFVPAASS
ncbi:hypothetical protein CF319_g4765 [Tilletia indica]|nr:hypothetical protein CF319_g4765 [Tilletia indica]